MKVHIKTYDDPFRKFIFDCMQRIPYFEFLTDDDKNNLQFNFEQQNYKKGSHIQ